MIKEIERKFLVKGEFKNISVNKIEITQTYLLRDDEKTIRIRISDDKAYLTIKGSIPGNSITRTEWEFQMPVDEANSLKNLSLPGSIQKTRYFVPVGKHIFEVDEFHGKNEGLVIAELELQSENEEYEKPDWLGEEVTGRQEYYSSNLI